MTFHSECIQLTGAERRAAQPGNSKQNKDLEKATVRNYFPNGVRREACSADLLCRAIRNDFPFGMDFTRRGLRSAQCCSGIQDEIRIQNKLPLEVIFQTGGERRAAQIHCTKPFEINFPFGMDFTGLGVIP